MSDVLLATKLHIPPRMAYLVSRPRLLERLDDGLRLGRRLTLISAPAGYGKTTLVAEWIRTCGRAAAWISLDEGDDDPARFMAYLASAMRKVCAPPDEGHPVAEGEALQSKAVDALVTLVNLAASAPGPFLIVFDDYQAIRAQTVHDAVAFLLDHLPEGGHIVIATRADPPLPTARLRGRGLLTELRLADLRFTADESEAFLEKATGLDVPSGDARLLAARTEGWIAGLQMATVAMRSRGTPQRLETMRGIIDSFAGSHRYILDYLMEEVFGHQPPAIREYLLKTSILDRMSASLCDYILGDRVEAIAAEVLMSGGIPDVAAPRTSQVILEHLDHANLFVTSLDEARVWYRYHRLFADLLRGRLGSLDRSAVARLHARASEWLESHGLIDDAISHALAAEDFGRAAGLIEGAAEATLMRSELVTFVRWVKQLPEEEMHRRPALNVYRAWALLWSGAPAAGAQAVLCSSEKDTMARALTAPLQALFALYGGDIATAEDRSAWALKNLPSTRPFLRGLASLVQAALHFARGDTPGGVGILEETIRASQQVGNLMMAVSVLCELGELRQKEGRLREAERLYKQALGLATDATGRRLPIASRALIGLGDVQREWNRLDEAERILLEGIAVAERGLSLVAFGGHLTMSQLRLEMDDKAGARESLAQARRLAWEFDVSDVDDRVVDLMEARLNLLDGDHGAVHRWAARLGLEAGDTVADVRAANDPVTARLRKYEYPVLVRLRMAEGRHDEALALTEALLPVAEETERAFLLVEVQLLRAQAYAAKGQLGPALDAVAHALSVAQVEGFVRAFLDEGAPVEGLLRAARTRLQDAALRAYAGRLVDAFSPEAGRGATSSPMVEDRLVERLTERESEVLRYLPSGLSSTEIASKLYVSANTLRSHLKSIYGKLEAHSRYEAIARARELGLL